MPREDEFTRLKYESSCSSAERLEHLRGESGGLRSTPARSRAAALLLAALISSSGAQAPDGKARAAETAGPVVAVLVPNHTVQDEKARAAELAFLAQVAPLFCPGMTSDVAAIRQYELRNGFDQKDLLNIGQLAFYARDEFRAFQEQSTYSQDVACGLAASQLGPEGLRLIRVE